MDDVRVEWLRDKVNYSLNISDPEVFEELINRDDGEYERVLAKFLNETAEEGKAAAIFYKRIREEEIEVEVEVGKIMGQSRVDDCVQNNTCILHEKPPNKHAANAGAGSRWKL